MRVVYAPEPVITQNLKEYKVFLSGSIEQDSAVKWQDEVIEGLKDLDNIVLINPRRKDWDSNIGNDSTNKAFREQVEWELKWLRDADLILMYFDPNTKSPISLLELGLFCGQARMIVCCPEGFYRKGNVDIVLEQTGDAQVRDLEGLIDACRLLYNIEVK